MKALNLIFGVAMLLNISQALTVYEDGEDGTTTGWQVRKDPVEITNIHSPARDSQVIRLTGGGSAILGAISGDDAWNNTTEKTISWKMVVSNRYTVYVVVNTTNGIRYLFYNDLPRRYLLHGFTGGILHGLGGYGHDEYKGVWRTYTRDLEADLHDAEPDNDIISVNGFIYSGSDASIDDIMLYNPEATVYEDGESGINKWVVSDNNPVGATISSVEDLWGDHRQGHVISLQGDHENNQYQLGGSWRDRDHKILQWKSRYYENYQVEIDVRTAQGRRTLRYINTGNYRPSGGITDNGMTIWHELGRGALVGLNNDTWRNGETNDFWQTVTRDLEQDIQDFEPTNRLLEVNSFAVRGSGLIDDVKMFSRAAVVPPPPFIIYEDAEDGKVDGWQIYDNTPEGATIHNVEDPQKGRVIEVDGDGLNNGYELGRRTGEGQWNNRDHKAIRWSMNYQEPFRIYVALETKDGPRYMLYSPTDEDLGVNGNYIRFGLGSGVDNGHWHTFTRNLEEDLHQFQPENELIAIHAFLIRGSGRLDDIQTRLTYQESLYEDAEDGNTQGWSIFANDPEGATISNVEDPVRGNHVIALQGTGKSNGYMLGARSGEEAWHNSKNSTLAWRMNYAEDFTIYISAETQNGRRYFTFTPQDDDRGLKGEYILLGLGSNSNNGQWQYFQKNLKGILKRFEPNNELLEINAFMIRGSGRLDDIALIN